MTQTMLDERYGRTRSKRARLVGWSVVGAIALGGVGYLAWTTIASSAESVDAVDTSFQLDGERSVTIGFQITANPGTPVTCVLEADDEEHGIVGWRVVQYPPSSEHTRALTETIPTVAAATTGLVNSCWVA